MIGAGTIGVGTAQLINGRASSNNLFTTGFASSLSFGNPSSFSETRKESVLIINNIGATVKQFYSLKNFVDIIQKR
jgi:hypothetical protein